MNSASIDLVAIGDAIVDVIAPCDDSFLIREGLTKGSMQLLSPEASANLYQAMGPARESSGGSAANSMAGAAALGLRAAFIGQVADDQLGAIFSHDMQSLGVQFTTPPISGPPPTGTCLILVTPDAQRTMNTCPGASHELSVAKLDVEIIRSAGITFLEGYLWGPERPRQAMLHAAGIARAAGRTVAFTLSESLCLGDRREGVLGMIETGLVDILFGNEHEIRHLTGCSEIKDCIHSLSAKIGTVVITRGAEGAIAAHGGCVAQVAAAPVANVVDTTGAGDQFAAGFLAGHLRERSLEDCLRAGSEAAAEVISHYGARPERPLKNVVNL